jgi:hypothetical protein
MREFTDIIQLCLQDHTGYTQVIIQLSDQHYSGMINP